MSKVNRIFKLMELLLIVFFLQQSLFANNSETIKTLYEKGKNNYDIAALNSALNILRVIPENKNYGYLLQEGIILQRIHFIHYVEGDKKKSTEFGNRAVEVFTKAIKSNPDSLEAIAYRGMVYQLLSGFSWINGAKYGPKAQMDLKTIKELNSEHFLSRFMDAVAFLESPGFFGGDTKKALQAFIELNKDFPDNEDVQVYLARAYYKEKNYHQGFEIIKDVLKGNAQNLFAQQVKKEIDKKLD
ncbi:hypothetical protein KKF86_08170 [bacterium]|nr:hypothetical protein [bacterium]